jgi:CDGSH-type Zn-finger protein
MTLDAGITDERSVSARLETLLIAVKALAADLADGDSSGASKGGELLVQAAARLRRSVIAPLERSRTGANAGADEDAGNARLDEPSGVPSERLWQLAREATMLRASTGASNELLEATAALQDLAYRFTIVDDSDSADDGLAELRAIQGKLQPAIRAARNGPYLVTNAERVHNWLGVQIVPLPQLALCRCGASALKPLCDGTHAEIGFNDEKDVARVPNRRDSYVGQQLTILDNRGTCAHSGFCTDRLASVFRLGEEPFVTPSGGRLDEILSAVRACPSGALGLALDGQETCEQVD